jgi:hypothetical protein
MRLSNKGTENERGQALILFTLMICVLLLCVMSVIDVGMFLHKREDAQQAADAAALAGAQDLPGNTSQAQTDALAYITKNGLSTANTTITFTCTSQVSAICVTGDGRYDTIVVNQKNPSPTYFGGVLSVLGFNNCWVTGCTAQATAAGCRGACGPIGTGPADIVVALDHSYSMSYSAELQDSKDAIISMIGNFNNQYQTVGLAVTPPVNNPGDPCDTVNNWSDPQTWQPVVLGTDFQDSNGNINTSSSMYTVTNCLDQADWPGGELNSGYGHTDLGNPLLAATAELQAHGRANTTWGIILLTDGAATRSPSQNGRVDTSTGQKFCTSQAAVTATNNGDRNGYETNASNACTDDGNYASDANSGTSSSTSCTDTGKDRHLFSNFGVGPSIPSSPTPTIDGLEIRLDVWPTAYSSGTTRSVCVELSWNNGTNWTTAKQVTLTQATEKTYILGSSTDNWGHTWSTSDLSNANFKVRITDAAANTSTTYRLDAVAVDAYYHYTDSTQVNKGPCDWAKQAADAAKALGIEIYTIGYGITWYDSCTSSINGENSSSPYYGLSATQFLTALATDSSHYYPAPNSSQLDDIFNAIGTQLTSGSRLVSCSGC